MAIEMSVLLSHHYWKDEIDAYWKMNVSFSKKEQIVLFEDLISQIDSGVTTIEAFSLFVKNYDGATKTVCQAVIKAQNEGVALADGFKGWVSPEVITSLKVGEEQGVLSETLRSVVAYLKAGTSRSSLFIAKATYPFFIICVCVVMANYVNSGFYELILTLKPISEWPSISSGSYYFWGFIIDYWMFIILAMIIFALVINYNLKRLVGEWRHTFDSFPIFKSYNQQQSAIFLKTLGLLLKSGISLNLSLKELESGATDHMRYHLRRMRQKVRSGVGDEGVWLDTGLVPDTTIRRLKTLASANDFEESMMRLADMSLVETVRAMEVSSEILKIILMFIAGISLASIYVGTFTLAQTLTN